MSRILVCIFLVLMVMNSLKVSGQITSPSADGSATTSYTNGSPNDDIFIFCGGGNNGALEVSVTAGSGPFVYQWFTYVAATHSWSLIVGQGNSTISNLASGGYRVEVLTIQV